MNNITGNQVLWGLFGIPATLGWIVVAVAWLVAPRFGFPPDYLMYGLYAIGGWYALILVALSGWFGLFLIACGLSS